MIEPVIISYGRTFITEYAEEEYRECLVRAFRENRADYITLDSNRRGQKFLAAGAAWAIDRGLLVNDKNQDDSQTITSSFRLTTKGKQEILGIV